MNQQGGQFSIGVVNCQVQFAINHRENFRLSKCMLHFTFYWTLSLIGQGQRTEASNQIVPSLVFHVDFIASLFKNGSTLIYQMFMLYL